MWPIRTYRNVGDNQQTKKVRMKNRFETKSYIYISILIAVVHNFTQFYHLILSSNTSFLSFLSECMYVCMYGHVLAVSDLDLFQNSANIFPNIK